MNNISHDNFTPTSEQELFISTALKGENILVNACIGSGKTTAIQHLCSRLPQNLKILYLTYNKLLKVDAKSKIQNKNVTVTNYHGFAYAVLSKMGISCGVSDLIQTFIKNTPTLDKYDVLLLDEYQDIDDDIAKMLEYIKWSNSDVQIIAVGDMNQKIYDSTNLDISRFIVNFLGTYKKLEFTNCFRLSAPLAAKLGRIWNRKIIGLNNNCIVEEMSGEEIIDFLSTQEPKDILCLGSRNSTAHALSMSNVLNILESRYPDKFNKKTVYASISDNDSRGKVEPKANSAIFTTYDSSKGLERKICVVFDYTEQYWKVRMSKSDQSYDILRNIFCVAASRGKNHIIFVNSGETPLSEKTLSTRAETNHTYKDIGISKMFDFKYKENVEECYNLLKVTPISSLNDISTIHVMKNDALIDLSPCVGIYQEAVFFENYSVDKDIELRVLLEPRYRTLYTEKIKTASLDEKILFQTSLETNQDRYRTQVSTPFVSQTEKSQIVNRLSSVFSTKETTQVYSKIDFADKMNGEKIFSAIGYADVVKDNIVYELKFVHELSHEHFLQCACYVVALGLEKGVLWNTQNNTRYEITIPNKEKFLNAVVSAITKNNYTTYFEPKKENIAVIDVETNLRDQVISIGIVITDPKNFNIIDKKYYIISPECSSPGMYNGALYTTNGANAVTCDRASALASIKSWLSDNNVASLFAYNASFDRNHLQELDEFSWYDIMSIAAYKQFNKRISDGNYECYSTGRLKRNYGVDSIMKMLSGNANYCEKHNALLDALDETRIMQLLGQSVDIYYRHAQVKKTSRSSVTSSPHTIPHTYSRATNVQPPKPHNVPPKSTNTSNTKPPFYSNSYTVSDYCSVSDAARTLGKSTTYVYNLIHKGILSANNVGGTYQISRESFKNYLEHLEKQRRVSNILSFTIAVVVIILITIFFSNY